MAFAGDQLAVFQGASEVPISEFNTAGHLEVRRKKATARFKEISQKQTHAVLVIVGRLRGFNIYARS